MRIILVIQIEPPGREVVQNQELTEPPFQVWALLDDHLTSCIDIRTEASYSIYINL